MSGKPIIFLGPTLKRSEAEKLVQAEFRGPAAMGDITQAVSDGAELIILVDGVFESGPSVWHKEILWALSRGIPVIGTASMGALRAAELHAYGMTGHGEVFESYLDGRLTDDDDVAVLHGPAETSWLALTDAMVDIKAFAEAASRVGLLTALEEEKLLLHAKTEHFSQRSFLASALVALGAPSADFERWFAMRPAGIKENDCRSLFSNLPRIKEMADVVMLRAPTFLPTVYLSRLQPFGFSFE
jgi:hypothetical protein